MIAVLEGGDLIAHEAQDTKVFQKGFVMIWQIVIFNAEASLEDSLLNHAEAQGTQRYFWNALVGNRFGYFKGRSEDPSSTTPCLCPRSGLSTQGRERRWSGGCPVECCMLPG